MPNTSQENNPAQVRGDIQRGRTGDKTPGFDPAAAPLETDGEAAGTPLTEEQTATARATQRHGKPKDNSNEYGDAMRPFAGTPTSELRGLGAITLAVGALVCLAALFVAAV